MLVELRVRPGDFRFRSVLRAVAANRLVHHGNVARVPHLSLYGNAEVPPGKWPELVKRVAKVGSRYRALPYLVDDYDSKRTGGEGNVIAFRIVPSAELLSFRKELIRAVGRDFPSAQPWDQEGQDSWFHISIGWKLSDSDLERVWGFLNRERQSRYVGQEEPLHVRKVRPYLQLAALRLTILGGSGKIYREFDLPRQKILTRLQALDWREWCKTLRSYRIGAGIEVQKPGILKRIVRRPARSERRFISDLHLDHGNIIRYTARPFCRDVNEMNRVLVNNWNRTVLESDKVYFLGDLTFGRSRKPSSYWWPKLKGQKVFVKGNHDDSTVPTVTYKKLSVEGQAEGGKNFAVVHDPNGLSDELRGWVKANDAWIIHGDKHNNNMRDYPFINGERKMINVSAEMVDYKPVSLGFILSLRLGKIKRMDSIQSIPVRW